MKFSSYISRTKDGFIATLDHNIDYLNKYHTSAKFGEDYMNFIKDIDVVLMGRNTYEFVAKATIEQGMEWPYKDITSYVISSKPVENNEHVIVLNEGLDAAIETIKNGKGNNCWVVGGATLIEEFAKKKLFSYYQVTELEDEIEEGIKFTDYNVKEIDSKELDMGAVNKYFENK